MTSNRRAENKQQQWTSVGIHTSGRCIARLIAHRHHQRQSEKNLSQERRVPWAVHQGKGTASHCGLAAAGGQAQMTALHCHQGLSQPAPAVHRHCLHQLRAGAYRFWGCEPSRRAGDPKLSCWDLKIPDWQAEDAAVPSLQPGDGFGRCLTMHRD